MHFQTMQFCGIKKQYVKEKIVFNDTKILSLSCLFGCDGLQGHGSSEDKVG